MIQKLIYLTDPIQQSTQQTNQYSTPQTAPQTQTATPNNSETNIIKTKQIINLHNV